MFPFARVPSPELKSHCQRVCALYKNLCRLMDSYYGGGKTLMRYHKVLLRDVFDCNKCVSDPKDQRLLLRVGEIELMSKRHPIPVKFTTSVGGVAHERVVPPLDWVFDYWHPLEKAQYPTYFATRECRKKEYIEHWNKKTLM